MNTIENILQVSMEHLRNLVDANTIIGTPITLADGSTIIPVSKVGMGLLTGGADIPTKTPIRTSADSIAEYPFGGTTAAGLGMTPVSFIIIQNGSIKVVPVDYSSPVDRLIDSLTPVIDMINQRIKDCNC